MALSTQQIFLKVGRYTKDIMFKTTSSPLRRLVGWSVGWLVKINLGFLVNFGYFCKESGHMYMWDNIESHKPPSRLVCWAVGWLG